MIYNPKHPGQMVNSLCLEPLHLSITAGAKALKISRGTFSKLINGHIGISAEMAIRLSIVFKTSEEFWMNLQAEYDLWCAQKNKKKFFNLKPYVSLKRAA